MIHGVSVPGSPAGRRSILLEAAFFEHRADTEPLEVDETAPLLGGRCSVPDSRLLRSETAKHVVPLPFPLSLSPFLSKLSEHFGCKLLVLLFASQHLLKGFAHALTAPASQYLLREYNVIGPRMQIFTGIAGLPMAMKPIFGLLSDYVPIRGFHKGPYILITSALGVWACAVLARMQHDSIGVEQIVVCLFLISIQVSTADLLTEAKYAEKMQAAPSQGPNLMSYVWFGIAGGGLIATLMVGSILEHFGPRACFLAALLPLGFIVYPVARNFLEETEQSAAEIQETRRRLGEQREALSLCFLMFGGTMLLTICGIWYQSVVVNFVAAIVVALIMLVSNSVFLRPIIARVNAFSLIQTSLSCSIGGGAFYFYTDTPDQYAAGPHFSMTFFTTALGAAGALTSLVGIFTYQRYLREFKYRQMFLITNLALSFLSVLDVAMFRRLNVQWGIPDHAFVLGASVFQHVISAWMWMPAVLLNSQLCPRGMEATMYALLAGCHNLGNTIASSCGAFLLQYFGVAPNGSTGEDHQFENLWLCSIVSTVLPMFTLLLLPWLIPDARQTDKLIQDDDRDATKGSLWRRWTGQEDQVPVASSPGAVPVPATIGAMP